MNPGENVTVQAPGTHDIIYNATAAGLTDATVTFYYKTHQQGKKINILKLFVFDILQ
jgi:hypothetical protein